MMRALWTSASGMMAQGSTCAAESPIPTRSTIGHISETLTPSPGIVNQAAAGGPVNQAAPSKQAVDIIFCRICTGSLGGVCLCGESGFCPGSGGDGRCGCLGQGDLSGGGIQGATCGGGLGHCQRSGSIACFFGGIGGHLV